MRYFATRDQQRHGLFLSVVVRRLAPLGQRCQNKIRFDRLQTEQIKQDEVKYSQAISYVYLFMFIVFISFFCSIFSYRLIFFFLATHVLNDFRCFF